MREESVGYLVVDVNVGVGDVHPHSVEIVDDIGLSLACTLWASQGGSLGLFRMHSESR